VIHRRHQSIVETFKFIRPLEAEPSINIPKGYELRLSWCCFIGRSSQDHFCSGAIATARTSDGVAPKRRRKTRLK
jgi:hypothetical protein